MSLTIHFDAYSETAVEDYQRIKNELRLFDILKLLTSELRKTRLNQPFGKKLIAAFNALDDDLTSQAFMLIANNVDKLYPIIPTVMQMVARNLKRVTPQARKAILDEIRTLIANKSYLTQLEINAAFIVRVLAQEHDSTNEQLLVSLFDQFNDSVIVRSTIILVMTNWRVHQWLSNLKLSFQTMTSWQRRAFIVASYALGDEGEHWRKYVKHSFSPFELLVRDWAAALAQTQSSSVPL